LAIPVDALPFFGAIPLFPYKSVFSAKRRSGWSETESLRKHHQKSKIPERRFAVSLSVILCMGKTQIDILLRQTGKARPNILLAKNFQRPIPCS